MGKVLGRISTTFSNRKKTAIKYFVKVVRMIRVVI